MEPILNKLVIVDFDCCKPGICHFECKCNCVINKAGKLCIDFKNFSKFPLIDEKLCIGCGLCVCKCPFNAIKTFEISIPLQKTIHRYGINSFILFKLAVPKKGQVLGLLGANGVGKTTTISILSGKLKPNLGSIDKPPEWIDIVKHFRGSELQLYLKTLQGDKFKARIKPQYIEGISKEIQGLVKDIIKLKDEKGNSDDVITMLGLEKIMEKEIKSLSGGELQRLAVLIASIQKADAYMFDEPSTFLDVKQRIKVGKVIRSLVNSENYVICVEHDLSLIDYVSDFVCCMYGQNNAYGVVTMPFSVREGINVYLDGFDPNQKIQFRDEPLTFDFNKLEIIKKDTKTIDEKEFLSYPDMIKRNGDFILNIKAGTIFNSQTIILLGENGTGKTTLMKILSGKDPEFESKFPGKVISYKSQSIEPKFEGTLQSLIKKVFKYANIDPSFKKDVFNALRIVEFYKKAVKSLSGGQLQRLAIFLTLIQNADIYFFDEPSAFLDSEFRVIVSKVIKRFTLKFQKITLVVEHDFIMSTYLADKIIVFDGTPGQECTASAPLNLNDGLNKFLAQVDITFRRDPKNFRPKINKLDSALDKLQKQKGIYFCMDE